MKPYGLVVAYQTSNLSQSLEQKLAVSKPGYGQKYYPNDKTSPEDGVYITPETLCKSSSLEYVLSPQNICY